MTSKNGSSSSIIDFTSDPDTMVVMAAALPGDCPIETSKQTPPKELPPVQATKRGRYVSRACTDCQKRKCTGEQPCQPCEITGYECTYPAQRSKRRKTTSAAQQQQSAGSESIVELTNLLIPDQVSLKAQEDVGHWKAEILERLAKLEENTKQFRTQGLTPQPSSPSQTGHPEPDTTSSRSCCHLSPYPIDRSSNSDLSEHVFQGGTNFSQPIAALNRLVGRSGEPVGSSGFSTTSGRSSSISLDDFPDCCKADLQSPDATFRSRDIEHLRATLKEYFQNLNPHYPCLNEVQFWLQFEAYLAAGRDNWPRTIDSLYIVALINLMVARVGALDDFSTDSKTTPRWTEFRRAEHLLQYANRLDEGNLMAIQCAIIMGLYLLSVEKQDAAYVAVGSAVSLCFQIGLHDQERWKNMSPFDTVMRQRVFWSLYCLDRNVSMVCGAPYFLRESDFRVDIPLFLDDKQLSPDCELPKEDAKTSAIPYLQSIAKWGKLYAEIWDSMFGICASKSVSQEFIATMDARIVLLNNELPSHLHFRHGLPVTSNPDGLPPYVQRQISILYLHINHLRMMIRREEMLSLQYQARAAETCVKIAANSVNAIYTRHMSAERKPTERHASVLYIAGALIPLICVIINDNERDELKAIATHSFRKALFVLQDIAIGYAPAQRTLQQFQTSVVAANKAIVAKWPQGYQGSPREMIGYRPPVEVGHSFNMNMFRSNSVGASGGPEKGLAMVSDNFLVASSSDVAGNEVFGLIGTDSFDPSFWETFCQADIGNV